MALTNGQQQLLENIFNTVKQKFTFDDRSIDWDDIENTIYKKIVNQDFKYETKVRGNCIDFVLFISILCSHPSVAVKHKIALVEKEDESLHLVIVIDDYVLDCTRERVLKIDALINYVWLKMSDFDLSKPWKSVFD